MSDNEKAPQERYLFKPFFGSSHWWALNELREVSPTTRVLDVGAGSGAMGRELKERGVREVLAVEIDSRAREHIAPYYSRVESSIEPLMNVKFDLVLLLDVLEHMAKPEEFLNDIAYLLAPGGKVLISVPNITHWSVRFPLLFGFFKYTERGILDKTHLQFFTRARLHTCMAQAGIALVSESASIEPAEFVLPEMIWKNTFFETFSKFRIALARTFPGLMAYQLLAVGKLVVFKS